MPNRLAISPRSAKYKAFRLLAAMDRVVRPTSAPTPETLRSLRNFLFLQCEAPLGTAIHATPLFEALRRAIPDAHITVAAGPMAASVLRYNPFLDRCVPMPNPESNFFAAAGVVRKLYRSLPPGPVCIATTTGNQQPRLALLALLAGRATRIGYTLALPLYPLALDFRAERPQIENNLDVLRALGHATQRFEPRIFFSREESAIASRLLASAEQREPRPRLAVVTQCSLQQPKQWPAERFQSVLRSVSTATNALPIFLGTVAEAATIESLRSPLQEQGISLAGKTNSIPLLAAVLAQCDGILSLDTGTLHVARAVGLPGVVLAPAWQPPAEWLPIDDPRYRILIGAPIPMPPQSYRMEELSIAAATKATLEMLAQFPSSAQARQEHLQNSLRETRQPKEHT